MARNPTSSLQITSNIPEPSWNVLISGDISISQDLGSFLSSMGFNSAISSVILAYSSTIISRIFFHNFINFLEGSVVSPSGSEEFLGNYKRFPGLSVMIPSIYWTFLSKVL